MVIQDISIDRQPVTRNRFFSPWVYIEWSVVSELIEVRYIV